MVNKGENEAKKYPLWLIIQNESMFDCIVPPPTESKLDGNNKHWKLKVHVIVWLNNAMPKIQSNYLHFIRSERNGKIHALANTIRSSAEKIPKRIIMLETMERNAVNNFSDVIY